MNNNLFRRSVLLACIGLLTVSGVAFAQVGATLGPSLTDLSQYPLPTATPSSTGSLPVLPTLNPPLTGLSQYPFPTTLPSTGSLPALPSLNPPVSDASGTPEYNPSAPPSFDISTSSLPTPPSSLTGQYNSQYATPTLGLSPSPPLSPGPAGSSCPSINGSLSVGSSGGNVTSLQDFLISLGLLPSDDNTGYFGNLTSSALASWQSQNNIPALGIVGPLTRAALGNCGTSNGSSSGQGGSQSTYFTAKPTSGDAPLTVTFTPNSSVTGYYAVNFGDGSSLTMQQGPITHTYAATSTFTATFMSDAACLHSSPVCQIGQQSYGSVSITTNGNVNVTDPGGVVFNASPTSGPAPLSVTFTVNESDELQHGDSYVVDYGDGNRDTMTANGSNSYTAAHSYTSDGTFTAKLYVEQNICGGVQTSACTSDLQVGSASVAVAEGGSGNGGGNATTTIVSAIPPAGTSATLENFWNGTANFEQIRRISADDTSHNGLRGIIALNGVWYQFAEQSAPAADTSYTGTRDVVLKSTDQGATWSAPQVIATPTSGTPWATDASDGGTPYYDASTDTWHYLFQCASQSGGWQICDASRNSADPMGPWNVELSLTNSQFDSLAGSTAWDGIGLPNIVEKDGSDYYATFWNWQDGYNNAQFIAGTSDFKNWSVNPTPIWTSANCDSWSAPNGTWGTNSSGGGWFNAINDGKYYYAAVWCTYGNVSGDDFVGTVGLARTTNLWNPPSWQTLPEGAQLFNTQQPPASGANGSYWTAPGYPMLFQDGNSTYFVSNQLMDTGDADDNTYDDGEYWFKLVAGGPIALYTFDAGTPNRHYYFSEAVSRDDLEAAVSNVTWEMPGLGMNGANSVVTLPKAQILQRSAPWTIEAGFTLTANVPSTQQSEFIAGDLTTSWLELYGGNKLCAWARTSSGPQLTCDQTPLSLNTPYTVDLVDTGSQLLLVVNSSLAGSESVSGVPAFTQISAGSAGPSSGYYYDWTGTLSKLAVYDYAIWKTESSMASSNDNAAQLASALTALRGALQNFVQMVER